MIQLSDFYGYSMYTISSDTLSVSVMSLGATVTRLVYRGRNVVVSLKTPDDYLQDTSYLGAIVGRYANRIAGGRFPRAAITCTAAASASTSASGPLNALGSRQCASRCTRRTATRATPVN